MRGCGQGRAVRAEVGLCVKKWQKAALTAASLASTMFARLSRVALPSSSTAQHACMFSSAFPPVRHLPFRRV